MDKGWVKLHRKILGNYLWLSEPFTRGQAWVDLIILTNHEEASFRVRGVKIELKRGQCGWSELSLSERWKWSRGKVRRFLKELENERQIVQQKNNITTVITIVNYDEYQNGSTPNGTTSSTPNGHQTDTNKNDKNNKEEKNTIKQSSIFDAETEKPFMSEKQFNEFWELYPKKVDKASAKKKFMKIKKSLFDEIISALKIHVWNWKNTNTEKQFIPSPEKWINRKKWEDEFEDKRIKDLAERGTRVVKIEGLNPEPIKKIRLG